MKRTSVCRLLPVVFALALAAPIHGQSFGFPWWKDAQFQKELSLTADQSARIDGVFQSAMSTLRPKKEELDRQEAELSRLIATNADEAVVVFQYRDYGTNDFYGIETASGVHKLSFAVLEGLS